jgi:PAT family beta-lactamase induction signal transducer AmpG
MPRRALLILLPLYLAQGLPYGFQTTALPILLRERGISLVAIGLAGFLSLPWLLKALWAPLVDRIGSYRSWILPLQALMTLTAIGSSFLTDTLWPLLAAMVALNLFAATQDIAVDGLAVRTLEENELGPANAIQVVGYKAGMLIGGGLLVGASGRIGWSGVFLGIAAIMALVTLGTLFFVTDTAHGTVKARRSFSEILTVVIASAKRDGPGFLFLVATYKLGETMIDVMFKPFLVDRGFLAADIGMWLGTYGMIASLLGSALGGFLGRFAGVERALLIGAFLRIPSLAAEYGLTLITPTAGLVIWTNIGEHFFGGILTTAMFALMMKRTERSVGATHYTLLASLEVLGKSPGGWVSGLVAQRFGYGALFALGLLLSVAYAGFAASFLRRSRTTG